MRLLEMFVLLCSRFTMLASTGLAVCLFTLLTIQVTGRYVFHWSPVWAAEGAQIIFVWLCFLGFAAAANRGEHVSIGYLHASFPKIFQTSAGALADLASITMSVVVTMGGLMLVDRLSTAKTSGIGISVSWLYAAPVVGGVLMLVFDSYRLIRRMHPSTENKL